MEFGSFLAGAAQAGQEDIRKRRDYALELKMRSAMTEMEIQKQKELFDYQRASPETTAEIFGQVGMQAAPGQRQSVPELGLLAGLRKTEINAASRKMYSNRDSMTGRELKEATGANLPIADDAVLNPMQVRVWQRRLMTEEPTAEAKNSYVGIKQGMKLFDELEKARKDAAQEIGTGPLAGRAAETLSAAELGKLGPKTRLYLSLRESHGTKIARLLGERGVVTDRDVMKALNIVPGLGIDDSAANMIFKSARDLSSKDIAEYEEAYPALKRKAANEKAGLQLRAVAETMSLEDKKKAFSDAIAAAMKGRK